MSKRYRSAAVPLAVTAILAAGGLAGCGSSDVDGRAICVEQGTQKRVNDDRCDNHSSGYHGGFGWYYLPIGSNYPAVGSSVKGGSTTKPSTGKFTKGGVSSKGGDSASVTRGGFGGKSSGHSVGG